ncbi:MAG: hypothetical protein WCG34_06200, partial [Leptolinea sp.]
LNGFAKEDIYSQIWSTICLRYASMGYAPEGGLKEFYCGNLLYSLIRTRCEYLIWKNSSIPYYKIRGFANCLMSFFPPMTFEKPKSGCLACFHQHSGLICHDYCPQI